MSRFPGGEPRYWDGRVRRVVSVEIAEEFTHGSRQRIETLECGHVKIPHFYNGMAAPNYQQHRVCWECKGWVDLEKESP